MNQVFTISPLTTINSLTPTHLGLQVIYRKIHRPSILMEDHMGLPSNLSLRNSKIVEKHHAVPPLWKSLISKNSKVGVAFWTQWYLKLIALILQEILCYWNNKIGWWDTFWWVLLRGRALWMIIWYFLPAYHQECKKINK